MLFYCKHASASTPEVSWIAPDLHLNNHPPDAPADVVWPYNG